MHTFENTLTSDDRYQAARNQHLAGSLDEAEREYQSLIAHHPNAATLRSNLGVLALQKGERSQGMQAIRAALLLDPARPRDWLNLAQCSFMSRPSNVVALLATHAISADPQLADAYALRGENYRILEQKELALKDYKVAISLNPSSASSYNNRGMALLEAQQALKAIRDLMKAQRILPNSFEININLGNAQFEEKALDAARVSALRARGLNPRSSEPWALLGKVEISSDRAETALSPLDNALTLDPGKMSIYLLKGLALNAIRDYAGAILAYQRAILITPDSGECLNNLGNAALEIGNQPLGLSCFLKAGQIDPSRAEYYTGIGVAQAEKLNFKSAIASHLRATQINPTSIQAHYNLSQAQLISGDYKGGWKNYEWRFQLDEARYALRNYSQPRFLGQSIKGKKAFLYWEQGFGDTIQFCRYAKLLVEQEAQVTLEVQAPLKTLISSLDPRIKVISPEDPHPHFDYFSPLLSLPMALEATVDNIPRFSSYLAPRPKAQGHIKIATNTENSYKIGIAWSGSTLFKKDHRRTLNLQKLRGLLEVTGLEFHCLQKEVRPEDEGQLQSFPQLKIHSTELHSFNDTAELIQRMDLVISVDTSIAHLAGAMGKPTWILLPYLPDHRWFLDRSDSPWYPSVRLFRQSEQRSWSEVLERVISELKRLKPC